VAAQKEIQPSKGRTIEGDVRVSGEIRTFCPVRCRIREFFRGAEDAKPWSYQRATVTFRNSAFRL